MGKGRGRSLTETRPTRHIVDVEARAAVLEEGEG